MNRALRQRHLVMVVTIAIAAALLLALGWTARSPTPRQSLPQVVPP